MSAINQFLQLFFSAKIRIGFIRIFYVITVISCVSACTVIIAACNLRFCNRRNPDSCITHSLNIWKLVNNALPVAALHVSEVFFRCFSITDGRTSRIICRISIMKSINHDLIDCIIFVKAQPCCFRFLNRT
ncbi:hypothetical protein D3C78_1349210 [compost metagenome]